jgi:hypothetical protein
MGPNGQPIPKSFVAETCSGGSKDGKDGKSKGGADGGLFGASGAGSCPK